MEFNDGVNSSTGPRFPRQHRRRVSGIALAMTALLSVSGCSLLGNDKAAPAPIKPEAPGKPIANAGRTIADPLAGTRPNILFITVDDMAPRDLKWMPKVRALIGGAGMRHDNAITPTPLCAPSRATWMSGQFAGNHGVRAVEGPRGGVRAFDENDRLPSWLQAAGYNTGFLGKYINGNGMADPTAVPPGWTDWRGSIDMTTYDFSRVKLNVNGTVWEKPGYQTVTYAKVGDQMIHDFAAEQKPWFLNLNYVAPHSGGPAESDDPPPGTTVGGRYKVGTTSVEDRYRDHFADLDLPDQPDQWRRPSGTQPRPQITDPEKRDVREMFQQRLESLQSVDDAVAGHLATLEKLGQLDKTLVVFMSDNGFSVGEHDRLGKLAPYYENLEVPLLVRGPGVQRGRSSALVTNADLPVTFAALAGATPTSSVDGIDIAPLWAGATMRTRSVPIAGWNVSNGNRRLWFGVRVDDRWTFSQGRRERQLYDLVKDPYEITNVAHDPAYEQTRRELRRTAKRLVHCAGIACQDVEWAAPGSTASPTPKN